MKKCNVMAFDSHTTNVKYFTFVISTERFGILLKKFAILFNILLLMQETSFER